MAPVWQLRRAGADDLEAIMHLETTIFTHDAWSPEAMAAELASEHGYYLVAVEPEHPGLIDGYAGLLAPRGSGQADVQTIAVRESARGAGLGRALMNSLIAEARRRDTAELFLEVRADNPGAQHLYRSLGFDEIGIRRRYYQPDGVDALVMRLRVPEARTALAAAETDGTESR